MRSEAPWPLVGRDEELALIGELFDSGLQGAVIAGVAGAGKTRLAREIVTTARDAGFAAVHVVASQAAATIPLGVFAPLIDPSAEALAGTLDGLRLAATAVLERAEGGRLVLVVDDAHHLDAASATLVHQLATDRSAFVVSTVRTGMAAPDAITALWKDGLAARLDLQLLSLEETAALIGLVLPGEVDPTASHRLWAAAAGNPLFLRELVRAAVVAGTLVEQRGVWSMSGPVAVSASIHDLVGQRLHGLASADRAALRTLAFADVLGLELLQALHPHADLEALEQSDLIRLDDDARRRPVSLGHPLYGEALRAGAPRTGAVTEARRLTAEVVRLGARRREDPLRVGTWRLVTGGEAPVALLATAAQQAYHTADFELAERLARTALASGEHAGAAVLLAQLLDERGQHADAEALLASVPVTELPPPVAARAALARADNLFFGLGREADAVAVLDHAQRTLAGAPTGELVANRAWLELHTGRPRAAVDRLAGVTPAEPSGEVAVCIVMAWALALLGDTSGALDAAEVAAGEEPLAYPAVSRHQDFPQLVRGFALLQAGRLDEADQVAAAGLDASLAAAPAWLYARWHALAAAVALERGSMRTAAAGFRQAAALQRRLSQAGQLRANLAGEALAAAQAGSVADAATAMTELEGLPKGPERLSDTDVWRAHAWICVCRGEQSRATALLREAAAAACDRELVTGEARLLHDLVRLGEARDAAPRLAELADRSDSTTVHAYARHAAAIVEGSARHVEEAAAGLERLSHALLAAEAFHEAASAHVREGNRRAQACRRRAAVLLKRCEGARTPGVIAVGGVAPLTPREREVLTMAATGRSSRAIAEQLIVSVRTVDNLLQRAYVKLGVHDRQGAAEALGLPAGDR